MINSFKISTTKISLIFFSLFIILGNLGRISPSFNIVEIGVLLLFSFSFFLKKIHSKLLFGLISLILLIFLSITVGIIKFSFNIDGLIYSIRLIIQLLAIYSIAYTLLNFERNKKTFSQIIEFYINIYFYLSILSIIILIAFPDSIDLWSFLHKFGIYIDGDPHINRVVSTYFDPNFFGNILLFPFILLIIQLKNKPSRINTIKFLLITFTLIFTFSRSTIASMLLLLFLYYIYQAYISLQTGKMQKKIVYIAVIFLATLPLILSNSYISDRIIQRFSSTSSTEGSTMARIESYSIGKELFLENPILGSGFNFTLEIQKKLRGGIGIDSSIQSILIGFGIIGTTFLLVLLILFTSSIYKKYRNCITHEKEISLFYIIYLLLSVFFLSNFNQLVFYPFWLLPTISFGVYLLARKL